MDNGKWRMENEGFNTDFLAQSFQENTQRI